MNKLGVVLGMCFLGADLVSAQPKPAAPAAGADPALAERIVTKMAAVKEGDIVEISTGPQDLAMAEEIALAVRTKGAFAFITYTSEAHDKKLVATLPAKYDAKPNAAAMGLAKLVTVRISLPAIRDEGIWGALDPARRATIAKANQPVFETAQKRNVRTVALDNGMAPSPSRAKLNGQTEAEMSKVFWDGIAADYTGIEDKGKALKAALGGGSELRIQLPNGTDLKMKVKGRKTFVSDGVISADDIKAGKNSVLVWLPAGEVYLVPVPGTAEGKLVDDRMLFDGKELTGVTAEIKAGKITTITAKTGWDGIKAQYDAAGPGKNEISVFDLGINPSVKATAKAENFVAAGIVTINTGNNVWAGGTNKEPFGLSFFLTGATVTLDGKPLVENGVLK